MLHLTKRFGLLIFFQCHWADGRIYKGEWKEGKADGYGIEVRPNGSVRHDGEWREDVPIRNKRTSDGSNTSDSRKGDKANTEEDKDSATQTAAV